VTDYREFRHQIGNSSGLNEETFVRRNPQFVDVCTQVWPKAELFLFHNSVYFFSPTPYVCQE